MNEKIKKIAHPFFHPIKTAKYVVFGVAGAWIVYGAGGAALTPGSMESPTSYLVNFGKRMKEPISAFGKVNREAGQFLDGFNEQMGKTDIEGKNEETINTLKEVLERNPAVKNSIEETIKTLQKEKNRNILSRVAEAMQEGYKNARDN